MLLSGKACGVCCLCAVLPLCGPGLANSESAHSQRQEKPLLGSPWLFSVQPAPVRNLP